MDEQIQTNAGQLSVEDILAAAQKLGGSTDVEKALPFEKKDEEKDEEKTDEKEGEKPEAKVEKSVTFTESELSAFVAGVVNETAAKVYGQIAEVTKGLSMVQEGLTLVASDVKASLTFQGASIKVLEDFHATTADVRKSLTVVEEKVEVIGSKPAGRKGVTQVEKSLEVETEVKKSVSITPLIEWAASQNFSAEDSAARVMTAQRGDYTNIPVEVQKAMGVNA